MPGSCGPLRRRPSSRLEATETIGIRGHACERRSASAAVNRAGLSEARTATAGVACSAMAAAATTAACGLSASVTSASAASSERAMPSSKPSTEPIHSTRRRVLSFGLALIMGVGVGMAIFPIVPRRLPRRQAGRAARA